MAARPRSVRVAGSLRSSQSLCFIGIGLRAQESRRLTKLCSRPARNRPNLVVQTHAHATRVLIENGRAVGVEYHTPRGRRTARAAGEVVVSGGAFGSPQLLLLSGIGPDDWEREFKDG